MDKKSYRVAVIGGDGTRAAQPQSGPVPGLLATKAPSQAARGRQKDILFVHLTLSGRPEETQVLTHDVVDAISSLYFQTPGSVTAALRKAINQSNQQLLQYNMSGAGTPREGALTCAVLRGEELYVVQVGESFSQCPLDPQPCSQQLATNLPHGTRHGSIDGPLAWVAVFRHAEHDTRVAAAHSCSLVLRVT